MTPFANYIQEYHYHLQKEDIPNIRGGKWIKRLYDKITAGLRDGLFYFDDRKANRAITFIENFCHHCEGRNDLITLELWQKASISLMFGIVDENGLRIFREVVLIMGRKNGKSLFASACIAYMAQMSPTAVLVIAFMFAVLFQGSAFMQIAMQIPAATGDVIQGIILLFILGGEFFSTYRISWTSKDKEVAK